MDLILLLVALALIGAWIVAQFWEHTDKEQPWSHRPSASGKARPPRTPPPHPPLLARQPVQPPRTGVLKGPAWVIDGDTIVIAHQHIRLSGIDAPEMDHPYGVKAKWALVALCKGQIIRAEFHEAQSHNREVATCYLPDGRDLSEEMVRLGFAIDWPKYSGGKYRDFETPDARQKLWRAAARQKGMMPPH